jgi:hypothetical protein
MLCHDFFMLGVFAIGGIGGRGGDDGKSRDEKNQSD